MYCKIPFKTYIFVLLISYIDFKQRHFLKDIKIT